MSLIVVYLIAMCLLSAMNACIMQGVYSRQHNSYFSAVFYCVVVSNIGHLFLALSNSLETVIFANKICYLGACFLPMFLFLAILRFCRIQISRLWIALLVVFSFVVLGFSLSVGYSDVFYASIEFVRNHGVGGYSAVFGPAHMLWNVLLCGYIIADFAVVSYVLLKRKNVSLKNLVSVGVLQVVSIVGFIVFRSMDLDSLMMPLVYVLDETVFLVICVRVKKYDISSCIADAVEGGNESAFVAFSHNHLFLGCNKIALHYFPELKHFRVDHMVEPDSFAAEILSKWQRDYEENNNLTDYSFNYKNRCFKAILCDMPKSRFSDVYLFKIEDETKMQRYMHALDASNSRLERVLKNNASHIQAIQEQMVVGMAKLVESRDLSTGGHIKRTSRVVALLIDEIKKEPEYQYSKDFYGALVSAAPMHDLGKIAIDDEILRKKGRFTSDELEVMKTHAEKGAVIVENLLATVEEPYFVEIAKNVARCHHERWDGTGYPKGLCGAEIPFEARVMAVADVYDALVSKRCYKEKMSFEDAYSIIIKSMGTHFDPTLKKYFINCRQKLEEYYESEE